MNEVSTSKLNDMCELIVDCPHFTPDWIQNGFIVIRNQNIRDGRLDLTDPSYTHREDFERRIKRAKPRADDIIFTREAPMGEVCMIPHNLECCIGQRQVLLRPKRDVNARYLFFALRSSYVRHQIFWNEGTGSTVSNVRIPVLEALKIPRLGNSEQKIGDLLGALDDKIELNRQMNETLEATARLFFKDWFVDFGPTRAKAEGRPAYLSPELWSLFPDALDDDDKPVGWELWRIEDLAEQCKGSVSPTDEPARLFEHYSLPAFDIGQEPAYDLGETIMSNKTPVPQGVILLSKLNPETSRVWIPYNPGDVPQVSSTEFLVFKPKQPVERGILYCLFRDQSFKQMLEGMVTGTSKSHQRISPSALLVQEIIYGSRNIFGAFEQLVSPILSQLLANRAESRTLAKTRDLLLPKLISGEIRLRDADKIAEQAL